VRELVCDCPWKVISTQIFVATFKLFVATCGE
jgi:hypothetical protein